MTDTVAPARSSPSRVAVVGWAAVGAVVFGSLVAVIPVDNPGVQACGPPIGFLLRGEADAYPDAEGRIRRDDGRIDTLTDAERDRAFEQPCGDRVADRMVPVAVLFTAGTVLGLIALIATLVHHWRRPRERATATAPPQAAE